MKTKPSTVHSTCKVRSSATENQPQHKCRWLGSVLLSHHLSLSPKCPGAWLFVLCPGCSPPSADTSAPSDHVWLSHHGGRPAGYPGAALGTLLFSEEPAVPGVFLFVFNISFNEGKQSEQNNGTSVQIRVIMSVLVISCT